MGNYRAVESFGDHKESIESVWVEIQMKGHLKSTTDYQEIFAQMREIEYSAALIQGQPGSGKTTLVKKIAYDWANQKSGGKDKNTRYDLILLDPLRSVKFAGTDLLEMTVGRLSDGCPDQTDVNLVLAAMRHLDLKALLILTDGLDELELQPASTLAKIFWLATNHAEIKWSTDKI